MLKKINKYNPAWVAKMAVTMVRTSFPDAQFLNID